MYLFLTNITIVAVASKNFLFVRPLGDIHERRSVDILIDVTVLAPAAFFPLQQHTCRTHVQRAG
jgi:hypothetical protein